MAQLPPAPLPGELSGGLIDNPHRIQQPKTGEQVTVGQHLQGVGVGPLVPAMYGTKRVQVRVQMLVGMPLPNRPPLRVNLPEVVAPHALLFFCAWDSSLYGSRQLGWNPFPAKDHGVAVVHPAMVVMQGVLFVLPDGVAFPIDFHHDTASPTNIDRALTGAAAKQKVPVVQQVAVLSGPVGKLPAVDHVTPHVDEVDAGPLHGRKKGVAGVGHLRFVQDQSQLPHLLYSCASDG